MALSGLLTDKLAVPAAQSVTGDAEGTLGMATTDTATGALSQYALYLVT